MRPDSLAIFDPPGIEYALQAPDLDGSEGYLQRVSELGEFPKGPCGVALEDASTFNTNLAVANHFYLLPAGAVGGPRNASIRR